MPQKLNQILIMIKVKTVLLLVSVTVIFIPCIFSDSCNERDVCKNVTECAPMLAILHKSPRNPAEMNVLRKAGCGFVGKLPKVCCPPPPPVNTGCYTPDGTKGQCINIHNCSYFLPILQKPRGPSHEERKFIERSLCAGPADVNVCCGPTPAVPSPTSGGFRSEGCKATAMPPHPESGCCGVDGASDRIFGGTESGIGQFTWLALIEYGYGDWTVTGCGGSLISGKYVLSAAHCVHPDQLARCGYTLTGVRLGEHNTRNPVSDEDCVEADGGGLMCTGGAVSIRIETVIMHNEYKMQMPYWHDIALLRLARMTTYGDFIKPICLPPFSGQDRFIPTTKFTVAGWGATMDHNSGSPVKMDVDLPYVNLSACKLKYRNNSSVDLWRGQMCAGGERGKDTCDGDSGGPLMYYKGNRTTPHYEIVGIVSFGTRRCGQHVPGVYTNVMNYLTWIMEKI